MASARPRALIAVAYEAAAQDYLRSLPPEHFMEATSQATQREITLASLALVRAERPEVHVFNELLVQYPVAGQRRPGQVVPDNMVVISDQPILAESSYNTPLEHDRPFWVLDYVSRNNKRKDYDDNFDKYEKYLKVPYFLLFYPEDQQLTLYRYRGGRYHPVRSNRHGRFPVAKLEVEIALFDGWVRFWYEGELLPLPADLQRQVKDTKRRLAAEKRRADQEKRRADEAARRADEETRRADEETHRADELAQRLQAEAEARRAAEEELARLRARLDR